MTRFVLVLTAAVAAGVGAGAVGGCAGDTHYSQTELNALQVREFDAPYDQTYAAMVDAIFDGGYAVTASDKRGGLVVAQKYFGGGVQIKLDQAGARRTAVRVSTLAGGQQQVDKERTDELFRLIEQRLTTQAIVPPGRAR